MGRVEEGDNSRMFQPNQSDVRRFFCAAYAGQRDGRPLDPMATIAARWIAEHPEYHAELADEARLAELKRHKATLRQAN